MRICQHCGSEGCKSEDHLSNGEQDIEYWYMQCVVCLLNTLHDIEYWYMQCVVCLLYTQHDIEYWYMQCVKYTNT